MPSSTDNKKYPGVENEELNEPFLDKNLGA